MGYKNKSYRKDMKQQMHDRFDKMGAYGESKKEALATDSDRNKLHSYGTYQTYRKHSGYFIDYVREKHPECTTLKHAEKYVPEWVDHLREKCRKDGSKHSAWTVTTYSQAVIKLYGMTPESKYYPDKPQRHRQDITRSRGDAVRDRHFSEKNNHEFVQFCKGTGCRRNIMEKLEGRDLALRADMEKAYDALKDRTDLTPAQDRERTILKDALVNFPDQKAFLHHRTDKGGRDRYSPIVGPEKDVERIIERMRETAPNEKVWQHVPGNADIHSYRGMYASRVYKQYARPIDKIPYKEAEKGRRYQPEVYCCRKDEKGKKLDKVAMEKASKALGHNRLEIVANNYLRGI